MAQHDPRDGIRTVWITATNSDTGRVLSREQLSEALQAIPVRLRATEIDYWVCTRYGTRAIRIRGEREARNEALDALGAYFYAIDGGVKTKWITTVGDFGWLRDKGYRS